MQKCIRIYICIAGALLFITAIAKLVGATGSARVLESPDPILGMPFRDVFWIIGVIEMAVSMFCLFGRRLGIQVGVVSWLAAIFLFYRLGLILVGYHKPCSCHGNLTDALRIPPQTADTAMKIIQAYLLIGSYGTLFWLWRQKRKQSSSSAIGAASL